MQRHLSLFLVVALAIAVPARASHHHSAVAKTDTKAKVATVKGEPAAKLVPASSPITSTKGVRLVVNSILPGGKPAAPKKVVVAKVITKPTHVAAAAPKVTGLVGPPVPMRLARLTAYWTQEDPWTANHESSTGVTLHEGHCAVDPKLIPYGSMVKIPGMGNYVAVDTGSAVISRQAAIGSGQTEAQRNALVVDLFFETRKEAETFAAHGPAYVAVTWAKPLTLAGSMNPRALPIVPTLPAGTVYILALAPSLADTRMPLAFRRPQM